ISLDHAVSLPRPSSSARDLLDSLAEIYSILVALEGLEKAFNKDSVPEAEYTELCARLLKQYRGNLGDGNGTGRVEREFGALEDFAARWQIECPRASERIRTGLPATIAQAASTAAAAAAAAGPLSSSTGAGGAAARASTMAAAPPSTQSAILATENFITFLDALRLGMASKDQLHPLLSEVIQATNRVTDADFDGRASIIKWLIRLNGMRAHEELDEEGRREIEFEVEGAYRGFKGVLG
ncbi:MAG: hypothetical protein LQ340_008132, partial [Diploschistes diacapsis]